MSSPAKQHLILINEYAADLDESKSDIFHLVTAKLLSVAKGVRPDRKKLVAFICTLVNKSDEYYWKRFKRVLTFVQNKIDNNSIIGTPMIEKVYTWVDDAYSVHPNMKSQTSGTMSMGWVILHCKLSKRELNSKSFTEVELVKTSSYVPYNIWFRMFQD